MRERKAEVQRARGRRRLRVLIGVLAAFSLAGLGWLAIQSSLLDVDSLKVRGARHVTAGQVVQVAAVEHGEPLLLVDRGAVARRVERLPWVREARVSLGLPSTLRIEVTERTPLAWVSLGRDAGVAIVDAGGVVLEHRQDVPEGLPELRRAEGAPAPGERLEHAADPLAIVARAPAAAASRIEVVARRDGEFVLAMAGVERVLFGPADEVAAKWAALEAVFERLGDEAVYQIDVRVPTAASVRRQAPAPEPPPPEEPSGEPSGDDQHQESTAGASLTTQIT